jgi:hypothetical protein
VRLNLENARRTVGDLEGRLENRKKELQAMRHVTSATPVASAERWSCRPGCCANCVAKSLLTEDGAPLQDAAARPHRAAGHGRRPQCEEARGCRGGRVGQKCGWDLTSYPPPIDGKQPDARHIEVKGRVKGASTVTITRNEILYALNQADKFVLAIVLVGESDDRGRPLLPAQPLRRRAGLGRGVD